jgi:predicted neuraminidase
MERCVVIFGLAILALAGCQEVPPCTTQMSVDSFPVAQATAPARFSIDAVPTDASKYPYNHASSIAELPNGDLLVVWAAGSKEAAADTVIVGSRRRQGESAWSAPIVLSENAGKGHANPVLFVDDQKTVRLFYAELMGAGQLCLGELYARTSTDHGETWSAASSVLDAVCLLMRTKPVILRSGHWLLPVYWEAVFQSQFFISKDRGGSWSRKGLIFTLPTLNLQPAVVECADGSLLAYMRNGSETGFTWEARSMDCGASWQTKERPDVPNPGSALDLIRLQSGHLLLICNPSTTERSPLAARVSADHGKTWSVPRVIEGGQPQLSYPSVIQGSDGMIHVSYSHRLTHIQHAEFSLAWLLSTGP